MSRNVNKPNARPVTRDAQAQRYEAAEDATDSALVAKEGHDAIEAMGTTLGAAASGVLRDVDIDHARQRLRDMQTILTSLGCYGAEAEPAGEIDGIWGPATRDAVAAFQQDHDMEVTGQLDADTYEAILNAYEEAMSTQAAVPLQDDFSPIHADEALDGHSEELLDTALPEVMDDTTREFLTLREDADLQEPEDVENLQDSERHLS